MFMSGTPVSVRSCVCAAGRGGGMGALPGTCFAQGWTLAPPSRSSQAFLCVSACEFARAPALDQGPFPLQGTSVTVLPVYVGRASSRKSLPLKENPSEVLAPISPIFGLLVHFEPCWGKQGCRDPRAATSVRNREEEEQG